MYNKLGLTLKSLICVDYIGLLFYLYFTRIEEVFYSTLYSCAIHKGARFMKKSKSRSKKIMIGSMTTFACLLAIYLGMSAYFMNHFYFGSKINYLSASGKTVQDVDKQIPMEIEKYTLTIEEQDGKSEKLTAKDIGLKYNSHDKIQQLKDEQNPFGWVKSAFKSSDYKLTQVSTYDESTVKQCVDKLEAISGNGVVKPTDASIKYGDNGYTIVPENNGNELNKESVYKAVLDAVAKGDTSINLEKMNCYNRPKYYANSKEIVSAKETLDKYLSSKTTYNSNNDSTTVDASKIHNWIKISDSFKVSIDSDKVRNFINNLATNYDTVGRTKDFTATGGAMVKVNGGTYGWQVDKSKETGALIAAIEAGKIGTREPIYAQTAVNHGSNEIGNTYVEIDLTKQSLWFYKNGNLVVTGNVVTGNESLGHSTPEGIYKINAKQKDATLKGQDYSSPVAYWMPFNQGIGIHDANWRTEFGKDIYKLSGSHGCINSPYELAQTIYENIEVGTPVVCHY